MKSIVDLGKQRVKRFCSMDIAGGFFSRQLFLDIEIKGFVKMVFHLYKVFYSCA